MRAYRNKVVNHFHSDLAGPDNASASDVYGGVTNNAISGNAIIAIVALIGR